MSTVRLSRHIAELACTDRPVFFGCDFYKRIRYSTARDQIFGSPYGFFWPGFSPRLRTDMDWLMLTQYAEWLMENFDGCFNRVLDESNHQNNQGHCAIQKHLTAYMCCCYKDKTVVRTSHIYNGNAPHGFILKWSPGPLLLNGFTQYG